MVVEVVAVVLLMAEILHQLRLVASPIICRVFTYQVVQDFSHQQYNNNHCRCQPSLRQLCPSWMEGLGFPFAGPFWLQDMRGGVQRYRYYSQFMTSKSMIEKFNKLLERVGTRILPKCCFEFKKVNWVSQK